MQAGLSFRKDFPIPQVYIDRIRSLPDEIIVQILGYLSLGELIQCATVSKSFNTICKDSLLRYRSNMLVIKDLTVKDRKSIIDVLIVRSVRIERSDNNLLER